MTVRTCPTQLYVTLYTMLCICTFLERNKNLKNDLNTELKVKSSPLFQPIFTFSFQVIRHTMLKCYYEGNL